MSAKVLRVAALVLLCAMSIRAQWFADIIVQKGSADYQCSGIFGTFGPVGTVQGRIIKIEPYTACTPIARPASLRKTLFPLSFNSTVGFVEPWIALVQRGGACSFYDKIMYAAAAGASAVVVGNVRVSEVVIMHDTRPVPIPAVSVSRSVATQLELIATQPESITVLTMGPQLTMVNFVVSEVLHDAAVFLVLLCGLTSLVTIVYYFRRRRFLRQLAQRVWAKRARVAAALNLLPVVPYKNTAVAYTSAELVDWEPNTGKDYDAEAGFGGHKSHSHDAGFASQNQVTTDAEQPDNCAICLDDFAPGDEQRALPCPHGAHFHRGCIDPWLTKHLTCPMCKRNFLRMAMAAGDNVSAEMMEAATIDDELEEEVSFEQLEAVDEMERATPDVDASV